MVTRVTQPSPDRPMINDDGTPSQQTRVWIRSLTDQTKIIGTGSPEGVVEAQQGSSYMDDSGASGSILYVKRDSDVAGDKTKGWVLV